MVYDDGRMKNRNRGFLKVNGEAAGCSRRKPNRCKSFCCVHFRRSYLYGVTIISFSRVDRSGGPRGRSRRKERVEFRKRVDFGAADIFQLDCWSR